MTGGAPWLLRALPPALSALLVAAVCADPRFARFEFVLRAHRWNRESA